MFLPHKSLKHINSIRVEGEAPGISIQRNMAEASTETGCSLYAELLTNIRQISLAASLSSPSDASTQVALSADGRTVQLNHHGTTYQLALPAKAALGGIRLPIQDTQKAATTLSWRLPLDASSITPPSHQLDPLSWSAGDLEPRSEVTCRRCSAAVVPAGAAKVWKDLPSENWAEMMEFWHCHKPDHVHDDDDKGPAGKADEKSLATRGYGASSAVSAQEGVGFVDLTTLRFTESDCRNVVVSFLVLDGAISACFLGQPSLSYLHRFDLCHVRASRR